MKHLSKAYKLSTKAFFSLGLVSLLFSNTLSAQTAVQVTSLSSHLVPLETLTGEVHDQIGEILIGSKVSLQNETYSQETVTDIFGAYTFQNVPRGTYTLLVDHQGYMAHEQLLRVSMYKNHLPISLGIDQKQMLKVCLEGNKICAKKLKKSRKNDKKAVKNS